MIKSQLKYCFIVLTTSFALMKLKNFHYYLCLYLSYNNVQKKKKKKKKKKHLCKQMQEKIFKEILLLLSIKKG